MKEMIENICKLLHEIDVKIFCQSDSRIKNKQSVSSNELTEEFVIVEDSKPDYQTSGSLKNIIFFNDYSPNIGNVENGNLENNKVKLSECINSFNTVLKACEANNAHLPDGHKITLKKAMLTATEFSNSLKKINEFISIQLLSNIVNLKNFLERNSSNHLERTFIKI